MKSGAISQSYLLQAVCVCVCVCVVIGFQNENKPCVFNTLYSLRHMPTHPSCH